MRSFRQRPSVADRARSSGSRVRSSEWGVGYDADYLYDSAAEEWRGRDSSRRRSRSSSRRNTSRRDYDDREEFDDAYLDYSDVSSERGVRGIRSSSRSRRDRRDGSWGRD
jgi:hypothetical protein